MNILSVSRLVSMMFWLIPVLVAAGRVPSSASDEIEVSSALQKAEAEINRGMSPQDSYNLVQVARNRDVSFGQRRYAIRLLGDTIGRGRDRISRELTPLLREEDSRIVAEVARTLAVFGPAAQYGLSDLRSLDSSSLWCVVALSGAEFSVAGTSESRARVSEGIRRALEGGSSKDVFWALDMIVLLGSKLGVDEFIEDLLAISSRTTERQLDRRRALLCLSEFDLSKYSAEVKQVTSDIQVSSTELALCAARARLRADSRDSIAVDLLMNVSTNDSLMPWRRCRALLAMRLARSVPEARLEQLRELVSSNEVPLALASALSLCEFDSSNGARSLSRLAEKADAESRESRIYRPAAVACKAVAALGVDLGVGTRWIAPALVDVSGRRTREIAAHAMATLHRVPGSKSPEEMVIMAALELKRHYSNGALLTAQSVWGVWVF